jgi:hypothetical protein
MACTYFHRVPTYAGTGAGQAKSRVDYITRQGVYAPGVQARLGREDCIETGYANLPGWAGNDPVIYFEACLAYERKVSPAQIAREQEAQAAGVTIKGSTAGPAFEEWRFTLPRELTRDEQLGACQAFLDTAFGDQYPYVYGVHNPVASDGLAQPHCHVIWSRRRNDGIDRTKEQWFKKYKRCDPGRGGAERPAHFGAYGSVKKDRVLYCDVMNIALDAAGHGARLHPDRLADRGFSRPTEPLARVSDSHALKHKGVITARWQAVLDHRETYGPGKAAERVNAQRYWQERREALGLYRKPREAQLARVQALRRGVQAQPARVQRGRERRERSAVLSTLTRQRSLVRKLAALSASLDRLAEGEEQGRGVGQPRLRLHEDEQERGMSW